MADQALLEILDHLRDQLVEGGWWDTTCIIAKVLGFSLVCAGLKGFTNRQGEPQRKIGTASIIIGTLLFQFHKFLNILGNTILGKSLPDSLWYMAESNSSQAWTAYLSYSLVLIQFFGLWYVIKSLLMFREIPRLGDAREGWKAFGHLMGGFLCVYMGDIIHFVGNSIGGDIGNILTGITF